MTIASQTSRIAYTGDGTTTAFAVPFFFVANTDIAVLVKDTSGNITSKSLGTDFTMTGAGVAGGGTCTFTTAPATSYTVTIYRDPPLTQTTSYNNNDPFPAKSHENALDKAVTIDQRSRDLVSRSLHLADGDTAGSMVVPTIEIRKGRMAGYNASDGTPTVSTNTLAAIDSIVSGGLATLTGLNRVLIISTYGNLQLLTPFAGAVVYMEGYFAENDGGGGTFMWDGVSVATANAGTIVASLVSGFSTGRWLRMRDATDTVNARWFGCIPGQTNCAPALQAAINFVGARGAIYIPGGDYTFTAGVTISNDRVYIKGDGKAYTVLNYNPTANGTFLAVGNGATMLVQGGLYGFQIYSSDTTYTKIAISTSDIDIYEMDSIGINGSAGWAGGTGSIGLKTMGRDMHSIRNFDINADRPIYIAKNPNHTISIDHFNFHNMDLIGASASFPIYEIQDGVNLTNVTIGGYQIWARAKGGLLWTDTTTVGVSQDLHISGVRLEQGLDLVNGWAVRIEHFTGLQNFTFSNSRVDFRQGIYLRKVLSPTINNVWCIGTTVNLNLDTTCRDVEWHNCNFAFGSTASLGGLTQHWASSTFTGPLPTSARYHNSALHQNEMGIPLSGAQVTVANGAVANIYTDDFSGVLVVTYSGAVGMFGLFGAAHVQTEISDFASLFSTTAGTASMTNIYWSAGNNRYEIQNSSGTSKTYRFTFLGRAS